MECPCRKCEERYQGCHAECEHYKEWKTEDIDRQKKYRNYAVAGELLNSQFEKTRRKNGFKLKQR